MTHNLNDQIVLAIDRPGLFIRIEECVLNAKTELAKRRLVQAAVVLGGLKALTDEMNAMAGW